MRRLGIGRATAAEIEQSQSPDSGNGLATSTRRSRTWAIGWWSQSPDSGNGLATPPPSPLSPPSPSRSQSPDSGNGLATCNRIVYRLALAAGGSQSPDSGNGLATRTSAASTASRSDSLNPLIRGTVLRHAAEAQVVVAFDASLNPLIRGTVLRPQRGVARRCAQEAVSIP